MPRVYTGIWDSSQGMGRCGIRRRSVPIMNNNFLSAVHYLKKLFGQTFLLLSTSGSQYTSGRQHRLVQSDKPKERPPPGPCFGSPENPILSRSSQPFFSNTCHNRHLQPPPRSLSLHSFLLAPAAPWASGAPWRLQTMLRS
jgi:hypothetical protein